jgi:hypothetical protein
MVMHEALGWALGLALAAALPATAPPPALDAEVTAGIGRVDDGDYDGAILTLDNAARRLKGDATHAADLAQAYVYLGIAYLGKGHEAAARARFREAVEGFRELTLSPDKFPPKVINLFEAARAEALRASEDASRAAAPGTGEAAGPKAKKGKTGIVLLGVGGAAAAGIGIAAAGGGGGSSTSTSSGGSTSDSTVTDSFSGLLTSAESAAQIPVGPATSAGAWSVTVTWTGDSTEVRMFVVDSADQGVGDARRLNPNSSVMDWTGQAGMRYRIDLYLQEGGAASSNYQILARHPR